MVNLSILGANGKMGQRIIKLAHNDSRYTIVAGYTRLPPETNLLAIPLKATAEEAMADCQVAIDFSSALATKHHIEIAKKLNKGLVIGTTGLDQDSLAAMHAAAEHIPILYSPNFSLGVALCIDIVNNLSAALADRCHIEITETHHIHKKDSPSGTALALASATGKPDVPIHSIRSGDLVGEHTVIFECGEERIQLTHQAHTRDAFAKGALLAAAFIAAKSPGLYSIKDLFAHK